MSLVVNVVLGTLLTKDLGLLFVPIFQCIRNKDMYFVCFCIK